MLRLVCLRCVQFGRRRHQSPLHPNRLLWSYRAFPRRFLDPRRSRSSFHGENPWINHFQSAKIFFWFVMVILMFFLPNGVTSFYARIIKKRLNTIVLVGLSGKTMLFFQLRDGSSNRGTVISMEQNDDTFILPSELKKRDKMNPVHVVDVPGHSRLRPKLDDVLPQAAGLIFVADALDFLPNCRETSEYLYDILTKASVVKKKIPLLVLCNKTDKVTAHSEEFIKKQLEKEIRCNQ